MMTAIRLGEGTRRAVKAWGLELLCKDPRWTSNTLTVVEVPEVSPADSLPSMCHMSILCQELCHWWQ